jgi:hypothetical protein
MGYSNIRGTAASAGLVLALVGGPPAKAQLEGKVLQQGLDQLAALNAYSAALTDGYRVVEDGIHTIRDIRQREWDLHQAYYGSLLTVNPVVKAMAEVEEILKSGNKAAIGDLEALLSDAQLSMTDGERIRRVVMLEKEVKRGER